MSATPSLPQLRVALFGQAGAGKTALLSSYYGTLQHRDADRGYTLLAKSAGQGNLLLQNYHQMEDGLFPSSTAAHEDYAFYLTVDGSNKPALEVHILDYPGGWWTQEERDPEAQASRLRVLNALTSAQVGFLIVDGAQYKDNGAKYLKKLFDTFHQEVKRLAGTRAEGEATEGADPGALPPTWIIALSKADLFGPSYTAEAFSKSVVKDATRELKTLSEAIGSDEMGSRFLLLSAARGRGNQVLDVHEELGLSLIAPLAFKASIEQVAEIDSSASGMERFLRGIRYLIPFIDRLDDWLPLRYQLLTGLLKAIAVEEFLDTKLENLKAQRQQAVKKQDLQKAAALSMAEQLRGTGADELYHENQPRVR